MKKKLNNSEELKAIREANKLENWHFKIKTFNNFPTAAGLASSSSGIACLVLCLINMFNLKEDFDGEFSLVARYLVEFDLISMFLE